MARRRCTVADFLTKSGQTGHAIAILAPTQADEHLKPATRAKRLGLLADAMLYDACFVSGSSPDLGDHVVAILEQSVALWRSCGPPDDIDEGRRLDEAALAQDLSNLCFQYGQDGDLRKAEEAGRESSEIFSRLRHPRLAQAEQHLAHVFKSRRDYAGALALYRQSVATFERTGAATFDTEYACSLSVVGLMIVEIDWQELESPRRHVALAYLKAAVAACEAITGRDHAEAQYYRNLLSEMLWTTGSRVQAIAVQDGADVELCDADVEAIKSLP